MAEQIKNYSSLKLKTSKLLPIIRIDSFMFLLVYGPTTGGELARMRVSYFRPFTREYGMQ